MMQNLLRKKLSIREKKKPKLETIQTSKMKHLKTTE
jgi:hypothetical protein